MTISLAPGFVFKAFNIVVLLALVATASETSSLAIFPADKPAESLTFSSKALRRFVKLTKDCLSSKLSAANCDVYYFSSKISGL